MIEKGRRRVMREDGTWYEGSAAPEHLPERLRELPGDLVTKDAGDAEKAHADDAAHVVEQLKVDYLNRAAEKKPELDELVKELFGIDPRVKNLNQERIDYVRFRAAWNGVQTQMARAERGEEFNFNVQHIWFKRNDIRVYEIRKGNPPPRILRPQHLRRYELAVDMLSPPQRVIDKLAEHGVRIWDLRDAYDAMQQRRRENEARIIR